MQLPRDGLDRVYLQAIMASVLKRLLSCACRAPEPQPDVSYTSPQSIHLTDTHTGHQRDQSSVTFTLLKVPFARLYLPPPSLAHTIEY